MAKRKRHRRRRLSASRAVAAPRRRRRMSLMTSPRRRKRRKRGLSELNLVKGSMGVYANPIIEGAMGGVATQLMVKAIPETIFTNNPTLKTNENIVKGLILLVGAGVAAHFKQPLIAAGMAGGAAILTMQKEGILQEDYHGGFSARGRFARGRFADPNLLSDARLLSEGMDYNIYPPYDPLYESAKSEFRL